MTSTIEEKKFLNRANLLPGCILAGAAIVRLWNIGWGLPELYEEATPLVKSWKMWQFGQNGFDFNPHFFNYPAFTFYLQFFVQAVHYLVGHLFGVYPTPDSFAQKVESLVIPARVVTLLFDLGTVYLAYRFARTMTTEKIGLLAAALVAFNPTHVIQSHYITVDTPLAFFSLASIFSIYKAIHSSSTKEYIAAGILIGLATATKYTGAFLFPVLVCAPMMQTSSVRAAAASLKDKRIWLAVLLAAIVFFAFNPYILLSYQEFNKDFSFEQQHVAYGHLGIDTSQSTIDYYVLDVLPHSFGWGLYAVLIAFLVSQLLRREKKYFTLLLFPIIYLGIISTWEMRAERYALPAFPALCIAAAIGCVFFWEELKNLLLRQSASARPGAVMLPAGAIILFALFLQPILSVKSFDRTIGLPDTRAITKQWMLEHIPKGSAIAYGPIGFPFPENQYNTVEIPFLAFESERVAPFYDARWYTDFDAVIATDYDYARYRKEPSKFPAMLSFYDSLRTRWTLLDDISATASQTGPAFWIYRPPDSLKSQLFPADLFEKFQATEESSRVSVFLRGLSSMLIRKSLWPKSEQVLREILSVEAYNIGARNDLLHVLSMEGKFEDVLREGQISLKLQPNQADVLTLGAEAMEQLGKLPEAEKIFWKAIEIDKTYEPAYLDLIDFYKAGGSRGALVEVLRLYRAILPAGSEKERDVATQIQALMAPQLMVK